MSKKLLCVRNWARLGAAAFAAMALGAGNLAAQQCDATLYIRLSSQAGPQTATVSAAPKNGETVVTQTVGTVTAVQLDLSGRNSSITHGWQSKNTTAMIKQNRGNISLRLNAPQYQNAQMSLYAVNGKRVLNSKASAQKGTHNISRKNLAPGVYMLSVKGIDGHSFTSKVAHKGGKININVAFGGAMAALGKQAADDCGMWVITASADGYEDKVIELDIKAGENYTAAAPYRIESMTVKQSDPIVVPPGGEVFDPPSERATFTETIGTGANAVSFDMVYIPGGTFTLGCESGSNCPQYTDPVSDVSVSSYFIGKTEVTQALWNAVMGTTGSCMGYPPHTNCSHGSHTWYEANEFACRLSALTGRNYRMLTEAEWEYAVKQPDHSGLEMITEGEEWTYNNWSGTHTGGKDPLGPGGPMHNQKTRRDGQGVNNPEVARFIRSIEGTGPHFRLGLSAEVTYPPGMVPACDIHVPPVTGATAGFSDARLITADGERWEGGVMAGQSMSTSQLTIKADGGAATTGFLVGGGQYGMNNITGQWYTINAYTLIIVPSSGTPEKFIYMMIDNDNMSLMKEGNMPWRFVRNKATGPTAPTVSNWDPAALAAANTAPGRNHTIDMKNPPKTGKDSRLILPSTHTWVQDNICGEFGGIHRYRKHFDQNSMWFAVFEVGHTAGLARSSWYTIDNTFLRAEHTTNGKTLTFDYLYAVSSDGNTLYHISYQGYERADFRTFERTPVNPTSDCKWNSTGNGDPTAAGAIWPYENSEDGVSTYIPPQ